jgi:putative peptidoglycan lipid II flippase
VATALAIPLAATSGVTTAGLNAQKRFLVAGCGTLIFNITVIGTLALGRHGLAGPLLILGAGIAAGAGLRLATQLASLPRDWLFGPIWQFAVDVKFIRGFITTALTASLILLVPVIVRALASTVSPGAISALNYATKLVELPVGVLVTSLATVALARLSEHHGQRNAAAARQTLHDAVHRSLSNAVGAGILTAYFAGTFIELALGRGSMEPNAVARVVNLTQIMMTGLPFLALASMATANLNAQERPTIVLKATLGCLLLLPVFALPGMWIRSESLLAWAIVGFQMLHAVWLARWSGLASSGGRDWCNRKLATSMLIITGLSAAAILLDLLLKSLSFSNSVVRCLLAIVAIGAVVVLPQRALFNRQESAQHQ